MKEAIHLSLQSVEGAPQPRRHVEVGTCNLGHSSDEQPAVGAGEKQRRPKAEVGDEVAVGTRDALDQAVQAQPAQGGSSSCPGSWRRVSGPTPERGAL